MAGCSIRQYRKWAELRRQTGFRSQFEADIQQAFPDGLEALYERRSLPYQVSVIRRYTPDWLLPRQAIVLEAKGRFSKADRDKMLLVKAQYPALDIRLVFSRLKDKISNKLTVAEWCAKHGFPCCQGPALPASWLSHTPGKESSSAFAIFCLERDSIHSP